MRHFLLISAAALPLMLLPATSRAVIVECANCSTIAQQLQDAITSANQLQQQITSYQLQIQQYQNMVQNTVALPQSIWTTVMSDISQVRNLANAASLLTGNSGNILARLQSAQGYAGQASTIPQNMGQQFVMWQQNLGNANNALGRTLGVQQGQEQIDAATQARIQAQSQSATGQLQVMQAGNELAALTNTQLNEMQTTLTASIQEQATTNMVAADRQAAEDAAMQNMLHSQNVPLTGYKGY